MTDGSVVRVRYQCSRAYEVEVEVVVSTQTKTGVRVFKMRWNTFRSSHSLQTWPTERTSSSGTHWTSVMWWFEEPGWTTLTKAIETKAMGPTAHTMGPWWGHSRCSRQYRPLRVQPDLPWVSLVDGWSEVAADQRQSPPLPTWVRSCLNQPIMFLYMCVSIKLTWLSLVLWTV